MRTLIVYKSCTGFTERYARLIEQKAGAKAVNLKDVSASLMAQYDRVVYGGGFYAGSLNGFKKAKALFQKSGAKQLIVFAVGAMPPDSPLLEDTWKRNFTETELREIPHFYLLGGLDYAHMKAVHKIMMKVAITGVQCAKEKDEFAEMFLKTCKESFDGFDPRYAEPLIRILKEDNQRETSGNNS